MRKSKFRIRGVAPAALMAVALLHTFVGVTGGWPILLELADNGWFDTVRTGSLAISRPLLFWFLVSGYVLFMIGHLALWIELRTDRAVPAFVGWELLIFALVAGIVTGGLLGAIIFGGSGIFILLAPRT